MRTIAVVLLLVFAFALAFPVAVCRATTQEVHTHIETTSPAPISRELHTERMTLIICATVIILAALFLVWRMNR